MSQPPCVSLDGTQTCPGFSSASISTDSHLVDLFPFLSNVTDRESFDTQLESYMASGYVQQKYIDLFGCQNVNLQNTTDLYARYSTSFVCNAIIQNSITPCQLSSNDSRPLCANACAEFALSEQQIVSSSSLCGTTGIDTLSQLRADFTNCALPANSITGACVAGYENEPDNCGFQSNLEGLCAYCGGSTQNSTDSCCYTSNIDTRCKNVNLPVFSSLPPLFTATTSSISSITSTASQYAATSTASALAATDHSGLSGADIAGIVIATVVGIPLLISLILLCFWRSPLAPASRSKTRRGTMEQRKGAWPASAPVWVAGHDSAEKSQSSLIAEKEKDESPSPPQGTKNRISSGNTSSIVPIPGSRITRMEALAVKDAPIYESTDLDSSPESNNASTPGAATVVTKTRSALATGDATVDQTIDTEASPESQGAAGTVSRQERRRPGREPDQQGYNYSSEESPGTKASRIVRPPRRQKSVGKIKARGAHTPEAGTQERVPTRGRSAEVLIDESSPGSGARTSGDESLDESERLSSFKDYYSGDQIHPGDLVSVLWAYQPRADDEFGLIRGQMLRVTGIWDDGWATGQRTTARADEHPSVGQFADKEGKEFESECEIESGETKAFPLVCVCIPKYWKLTVQLDEQTNGTTQMERFFNHM